jgi:hypothetical protein
LTRTGPPAWRRKSGRGISDDASSTNAPRP